MKLSKIKVLNKNEFFTTLIIGSEFHEKCDIGQYSDKERAESDGDCVTCPPGSACPILGTTTADMEPCEEGYYCPSGSSSRRANICDEGYYCTASASEPTVCTAGSACSVKGRVYAGFFYGSVNSDTIDTLIKDFHRQIMNVSLATIVPLVQSTLMKIFAILGFIVRLEL